MERKEFLQKQLELLKEKRENSELEWQDICDFRIQNLGISEHRDVTRKGSKLINEYIDAGWDITPPLSSINIVKPQDGDTPDNSKETITINADNSQTSERQFYIEDESKLRDYDYLLKLHNFDPHYFEIASAKNSKWNQSSKENGIRTLYSSKITVKPKSFEILHEDIEKWFTELDRKYEKPKKINKINSDGDKLLILPISDLHYGLRASLLETGNEYNCQIAEKLFFDVINDVITRIKVKNYNFRKIVFPIGNDSFNADNLIGTTTKGTPQDQVSDLYSLTQKMFEITVKAIDILADIAPVDVIHIPSNHDKTLGYMLANYIKAWYRNDDRIFVDTSPLPRKYITFGKTLFCFAHDGDLKKLPKLIPDEARQYWSDINYTECFLAHLHSEQVLLEENNMRIQRLPTISAKSAWTVGKGLNARRQNKSFIYDVEDGLTDVIYTTIK